MTIEHLRTGIRTGIYHTSSISKYVRVLFNGCPVNLDSTNILLSENISIELQANLDGAVFIIGQNGERFTMSFCCFTQKESNALFELVKSTNKKCYGDEIDVIEPTTSQWVYSFILNPTNRKMLLLARKIDLYIFEQLALDARLRTNSLELYG